MVGVDGRDEAIGEPGDAIERWRHAAEETLHQLDWAIGYLRRIGKTREADVLAANRRVIRQRLPERPAD